MATIVVTASENTSSIVQAMREGAYDYLTKPVPLSLLTLRVQKALQRRARLADNTAYNEDHRPYPVENKEEQPENWGVGYHAGHSR